MSGGLYPIDEKARKIARRPVSACLVQWFGTASFLPKLEDRLVAILPSRCSAARTLAECEFKRLYFAAYELRAQVYASKTFQRSHQMRSRPSMYAIGHSQAFVCAHEVLDLRVELDEEAGTESIRWTVPECWGNAPDTHRLTLIWPKEERVVVRPIRPLLDW